MKTVLTPELEIAYEDHGATDALPAILLHGFPYDARTYDQVAPRVANAGYRALVPYLRGYGPTRFRSADTVRSGQQAALGNDLLSFMDALDIPRAVVAGYDWGGRAACIASALWPDRIAGLVSGNGYNLQNIPAYSIPADPEAEHRYWYQYYFHTERGRAGLTANRRELCRLLWRLWSPTWSFDNATFNATATSFDNPDFVDVVIHSYRHRYGYVEGDPMLEPLEKQLEEQPEISVPTIVLQGSENGVAPAKISETDREHFPNLIDWRTLENVGHNLPQEAPEDFSDAVIALCNTA